MKNIIKSILLIFLLVVSTSCKSTSNKELNYDNFDLAIMIEEGDNKYKDYEGTDWPNKNDYALNLSQSTCNDGGNIEWDEEKGMAYLTTKKWDKCVAKFDKIIKIEYIEDLVDLSNTVNGGNSLKGKTVKLMRDLDFKNSHANGSNEIVSQEYDFDKLSDEEKNKIPDYKNANETKYNDFNKDGKSNLSILNELTDEEGSGFLPIGDNIHRFQGNFDGNNHRIDNIYINNSKVGSDLRLALFGEIENSIMKDFTISGQIKTKTKAVSAGFIGGARGINLLNNIVNYVSVTSESNGNDSAGIIGDNYGNTTIKNCKNYGNISGGNNTSGVVGYSNGPTLTIENSSNFGIIENNLGEVIGGIVGVSSSTLLNVTNSYNEGEIKVNKPAEIKNNSFIGGLIARSYGLGQVVVVSSGNKGNINVNIATTNTDSSNGIKGGGIIGQAENKLEINASYNKGNFIVNSTFQQSCVAGLLGASYKELMITDSFNEGEISYESKYNIVTWVAGIVACINADSKVISIIENCYNIGEINGGARNSGILAQVNKGKAIINKCYNAANLTGQTKGGFSSSYIGGILCYSYDGAIVYILNSFNQGNLTSEPPDNIQGSVGGIIYYSDNNNSFAYVLNSYNTGNLSAKNNEYSVGGVGENGNLFINNIYNTGILNGNAQKYSIALIYSKKQYEIKNAYYQKQDNIPATNKSDITGTEITEQVKSNLVSTLNQNKNKINLADYGDVIKDYELVDWVPGSDGYPTLSGLEAN